MPEAKGQPEPSMQEIFASIRRIMTEEAEDPPSLAAAAPGGMGEEDVLELTEMLAEDGSVVTIPARPPALDPPVLDPPVPAAAEPAVKPPHAELLSAEAAAASIAALAKLMGEAKVPLEGPEPAAPPVPGMEEMTRDMLHPMLAAWLEENLPRLVERIVREEIERLARDARRG